jgi:hypothetical protein
MSSDTKKSKWGWGIAIFFIGSLLFILTLVLLASFRDVQLVEDDYYQKGLDYQQQIDRIKRTNELDRKVTAAYNTSSGNIEVTFPSMGNKAISGTIKMFRPSNRRYDFEVPIKVDSSGVQEIASEKMLPGYWQLKILWKVDSVEYFSQIPLMVN